MFNKLILAASALLATSFVADASMAPSYPSPGTVWKSGQQYDILWADDNAAPSIASGWKDFKIDFMTGDNSQQVFLSNVASNLDGTKISKFTWTAPEVKPNAAVYFFMFSNGKDSAWTTRFGITGADGVLAEPEHATQPTGEKIPWGTGALASGGGNSTASGNSTQSAVSSSASAAASGAASSPAVSAASDASSSVAASSSASGASGASAAGSSSSASAAASSDKAENGAGSLARPLAGFAIAAVAAGILI
ncbi:hypothetical protein BCR42DRAFT_422217 [Absidia repens]|uniref:Yeast cell wall synthesis Kre9/Knh1-like N-terminal domain-containing protein n=1 Tax=Absidia repens TaxID=90262 RepID=A0A1X2I7G0_9FUNG|nr:hypothetical protein BCR42DRAFT_422217 [Absidia repens]